MTETRQNRRLDILHAALEEFSERGFAGARMEGIARRAGIGKSTVYEYFPSKLDIVQAASEHIMGELEEEVAAIFAADRPLREKMRNYLHFMYALLREMHGRIMIIQGEPPVLGLAQECAKRASAFVMREAGAAVRHAQESGEVTAAASWENITRLLIVLPNPQFLVVGSGEESEKRIDEMIELLFSGLTPR